MNVLTFVVVLIGWIFSLCLHEFSHALVAYLGGDTTVKDKGYLTFNPLKYTHPVYSLLLPLLFLVLGGIGLPGGAVYIETWRLRSRTWMSAVSLAGPTAKSDARHHPWTRVALRACDLKRTLARHGFSRPVASDRGRIEFDSDSPAGWIWNHCPFFAE